MKLSNIGKRKMKIGKQQLQNGKRKLKRQKHAGELWEIPSADRSIQSIYECLSVFK